MRQHPKATIKIVIPYSRSGAVLDRDFKKKYPDKDSTHILNWEKFNLILKQLLKIEVKDSYGKKQLKKLEKLEDVPPHQVQKLDSGDKIKANLSEARDAFVLHVTVPGDIDPAIQRRRAVALKLKSRIQPFVVLVGPTIEQYEACYLIIDDVKYQFNNVLKAFDQCFKAI
ncbi:hypothetical protein ALC57_05837 [Trachymyrmex cornetzi]|uniref:Uncharacterized protein n=1 Tax=Trachymyrmex cornetzi TaxID=471704 RepID=A0A151J9T9_9HYME|nr:hypothetical protein ALC57_05837 [Trachymyrmex cornetzi]